MQPQRRPSDWARCARLLIVSSSLPPVAALASWSKAIAKRQARSLPATMAASIQIAEIAEAARQTKKIASRERRLITDSDVKIRPKPD